MGEYIDSKGHQRAALQVDPSHPFQNDETCQLRQRKRDWGAQTTEQPSVCSLCHENSELKIRSMVLVLELWPSVSYKNRTRLPLKFSLQDFRCQRPMKEGRKNIAVWAVARWNDSIGQRASLCRTIRDSTPLPSPFPQLLFWVQSGTVPGSVCS